MNKPISLLFVFVLSFSSTARAGQPASKKQIILDTMEKLRTDSTPGESYDLSYKLAKLTKGAGQKDIDDKIIANMIPFLDKGADRYWVAVSLGNLGRRARIAVPKLYQILVEEECHPMGLTSTSAIRGALERIGVKPPHPRCDD